MSEDLKKNTQQISSNSTTVNTEVKAKTSMKTNVKANNADSESTKKPQSTSKTKTTLTKPTGKYFYGVGRRKSTTARAKYYPSSNQSTSSTQEDNSQTKQASNSKPLEILVSINNSNPDKYFPHFYRQTLEAFFQNVGLNSGQIALYIKGGGFNGQSEAARLAIAKALVSFNPDFRPILRSFGYLTTDNRKVLSKRPGLRKARKSEQWSKR